MPKTRRLVKTINILLNDIADIFPYLFAFYLVSLILSLFFGAWREYFNWPIFHINIALLALLGFLSPKVQVKLESYNVQRLIRKHLWRSGYKKYYQEAKTLPQKFIALIKISLPILKQLIILALKSFIYIFISVFKIKGEKKGDYLKLLIITIILVTALYFRAKILEILILIFGFRIIIDDQIDNKIPLVIAFILLIACLILLTWKQLAFAESISIFIYYLLIIFTLAEIRFLIKSKH